jgi:hypothetical protein
MIKKLWLFRKNREGIILAGVIAISFIFFSSIVWLVGALVVNRTVDAFLPMLNQCDPRALAVSQNWVNAYGVSIVIIDVLFLVWWGLSSSKKESQEQSDIPFGGF